jgi:putative oxidoreductase
MTKDTITPQTATYFKRTAILMGSYVAINAAAMAGIFDGFNTTGKWAIALTLGALIAAHIWSFIDLIEQSDEYVRAFTVRLFVVASGLSMAIFSAWGFAESYVGMPHAPGWFIFGLFWGCFGLASPLLAVLRK